MALWAINVMIGVLIIDETVTAVFSLVMWPLFIGLSIWMGIKGNEMTAKNYLETGWQFADGNSDAVRYAKGKWGIVQPDTLPDSHQQSAMAYPEPCGGGLKVVGTVVACVAVVLVVAALTNVGDLVGPSELPKCESSTAQQMVKDAVKNGPLSRLLNLEILALKNIATRSASEDKVVCTAFGISNGDDIHLAYTFEWLDKAKGEFIVKVSEDDEVSLNPQHYSSNEQVENTPYDDRQ